VHTTTRGPGGQAQPATPPQHRAASAPGPGSPPVYHVTISPVPGQDIRHWISRVPAPSSRQDRAQAVLLAAIRMAWNLPGDPSFTAILNDETSPSPQTDPPEPTGHLTTQPRAGASSYWDFTDYQQQQLDAAGLVPRDVPSTGNSCLYEAFLLLAPEQIRQVITEHFGPPPRGHPLTDDVVLDRMRQLTAEHFVANADRYLPFLRAPIDPRTGTQIEPGEQITEAAAALRTPRPDLTDVDELAPAILAEIFRLHPQVIRATDTQAFGQEGNQRITVIRQGPTSDNQQITGPPGSGAEHYLAAIAAG